MNIPQILLGTYKNNKYSELLNSVAAAVECGFTGFDTAPSYKSETELGKAIKDCSVQYNLSRKDFFISDKIDAWQMQEGNGDVQKYVDEVILKMDIDYIDLLLIHWPIPEFLDQTWRNFEKMYKEGIVKNIGICNLRLRHLKQVVNYRIPPQYLQIERHPLRICEQELAFCQKNNIKVISYSPLCQMNQKLIENIDLRQLAKKYNKSIGQIILRWHLDTCCIPVFMSKKTSRVKENFDIFDFSLSPNEIETINSLNENYKIFLESWGCAGF